MTDKEYDDMSDDERRKLKFALFDYLQTLLIENQFKEVKEEEGDDDGVR